MTTNNKTTFDFQDGNGLVPAHCHPNGGGLVADTVYVEDTAYVGPDAKIYGNAIVCQDMWIQYGNVDSNLTDKVNIKQNIFAQTGLTCEDDYVICYKKVRNDLTSLHDSNFQYVIGEWIEVVNPEISDKSCASGLHFSYKTYWNVGNILLECKVMLEDIITVQEGKIRAKKCFVIGKVE